MTHKADTDKTSGTTPIPAEWQHAYVATAAAIGASWCDFIGERFHAYAHAIGDVGHCNDLNEAWQVQATFGQETVKAYNEQTAKLGNMMIKASNGDAGDVIH